MQSLRSDNNLRCDDSDATMANGICDSGTCRGCPKACAIAAGTFDPVTQQCSAPTTAKADGTTFDSETNIQTGRDTRTHKTVSSKSMNQLMWIVR